MVCVYLCIDFIIDMAVLLVPFNSMAKRRGLDSGSLINRTTA